jgi:hypothetical protein
MPSIPACLWCVCKVLYRQEAIRGGVGDVRVCVHTVSSSVSVPGRLALHLSTQLAFPTRLVLITAPGQG